MSVFEFVLSIAVPILIAIYTVNVTIWYWKRRNRLAAVGSGLLALLGAGFSIGYFTMRVLL
ncbi:hypothetical protein [Ferroacidibacillus organovorans]|uniref:Uncharacterized protein n=1 Tax=Ferroacidibacillus organovorans TaxID=1765683 RepID=A0A162USY3_9BACL|nr:hypothetical protein [Ferroacidibacillus organovorans]KYP82017.1 hypothetical protein AYJ22_04765 [Ferroacidibacillus organovorans]OAG94337.1 hypothetical protein AYW79_05585 [Ferroacidibacillus organovorans]OPG15264.1 hypothetical protein B2M26_12410 [Ferroacidibacillus organovorans]